MSTKTVSPTTIKESCEVCVKLESLPSDFQRKVQEIQTSLTTTTTTTKASSSNQQKLAFCNQVTDDAIYQHLSLDSRLDHLQKIFEQISSATTTSKK
jgi:hypothetical protein